MYIFIILYNVGFSINKAVILVFYQIHIIDKLRKRIKLF